MNRSPYVLWQKAVIWKRIDGDWYPKTWKYQCVDLVREYCNTVLRMKLYKVGNAKDRWSNKYKIFDKTRTKIIGTKNLCQWDIVINAKWEYGHIWIIDQIINNNIIRLEQNGVGWWNWLRWNSIRLHPYPMSFATGVWRCKKIQDNLALEDQFIVNKLKNIWTDVENTLKYKNTILYKA